MKTKKYSLTMTAVMVVVLSFVFSAFVQAQFVAPVTTVPNTLTPEEVRTGSTVTYDISTNHTVGDTYRWAVLGGTITTAGAGTSGDTSVIEFASGLDVPSINVQWDEDLSAAPVGSATGIVLVQKQSSAGGCASTIQLLDIVQWNNATAAIGDVSALPTTLCSGEVLGGVLPVNLTGAPDPTADGFLVTYNIVATGLTDLGGNTLDVTGATAPDNDALLEIALPDGLVNTGATDATFTLTLTAMHDDFDGDGTVIVGSETYTITVYATPDTGEIVSSSSLSRRL